MPNATSPRGEGKQQMPPKFSRYRSVRKAAANRQTHEPPPPPPPPATKPNPNIARSMSRYRRNKPNALAQSSNAVPPLPTQALNQVTEGEDAEGPHWKRSGGRSAKASRDPSVHSGNNAPHDPPMEARILDMAISSPTNANGDFMDRGRKDYSSGGEQCGFYSDEELGEGDRKNRKSRAAERSRERKSRISRKKSGYGQKEAEETVPEIPQNYRGNERQANRSVPDKNVPSKPVTLKEKLSLVSRGGKGERENLKNKISSPKLMDTENDAGPRAVEQAPVVDTGARKVQIQYNGFSISMPITASTTPKEALSYAAEHLSDDVDPNTSFLMESFSQLELDRPVRMYEHVQDILNSWGSDSQNFLVVSLARDGGPQTIQPGGAPLERPEESSFHVYHSSRPGKWNKRWITLRPDGQVVVCKKLGVEPSNICHLSDYDIYTPTAYQMSKRIKPPKKICFAIKSQQKSNLFMNTENFVHYVCSNDATTIDALYKAVQEWRSWYLGYTMGKIQTESKRGSRVDRSKSSKVSTPRSSVRLSEESASNHPVNLRNQVGRKNYTQGGSEPNSRRNSQRSSSREHGNPNGGPSRRVSMRGRGPPPTTKNASRLSDEPDSASLNNNGPLVKNMSPEEIEEATFAPTGLLGRTYSQRQKAQREREREQGQDTGFDGPFSRTGLINNPGKNTTVTSSQLHKSLPDLPPGQQQPLVDLTPVFKEPIHHQRKGGGIKVDPGQPLVEGATGREVHPGAIVVPKSTTFTRPRQGTLLDSAPPTQDYTSFNPSNGGNLSRKNTTRTISRHRTTSHPNDPELTSPPLPTSLTRPSSPEGPFSPGGLLARSGTMGRSQGAAIGGRGIATGDRNATSKPLVDLSEKSEFVEGSLLHRVEKWDDGNNGYGNVSIPEPIIDRERD